MRLFYKNVLNEFLDSTTERYSAPEHNLLLARPDNLVIQIRALKITGSPTLFVYAYRSDDGVDWDAPLTILNGATLTAGSVYFNMLNSNGDSGGGHVRLSAKLGVVSTSAQVELTVCGRGRSTHPQRVRPDYLTRAL